MNFQDWFYRHGFLLGVSLWFFYLVARLQAETDDLKAYKKGTLLVGWLLFALVILLNRFTSTLLVVP